jgi:hypothetical protein
MRASSSLVDCAGVVQVLVARSNTSPSLHCCVVAVGLGGAESDDPAAKAKVGAMVRARAAKRVGNLRSGSVVLGDMQS